ncbi:conjugal transfer protein [Salmonella enterica subsp. enterica]|nr:conjugal transfer protein [Salmonella enterica subsp. enterica serovar Newport]EAB5692248.1 conjugal transfer protein [Salmonella enterica subsp. enterica serovar Newport]EBU6995400.1 conjugal transfer protein [Salmonella enterica subsp. enterica serovar Newport]EEB7954864.1 conjugal transfer protein [Salmonella enterica subsp. enterica serovar Newport]
MNNFERYIYQRTFSAADRIELYDDFRQYLLDGLSAQDTFAKLIDNYTRRGENPGNPIGKILKECSDNLKAGFSLSESLRKWIPDQELSIIESCDTAGRVADGFLNAMFIAEGTEKILSSIKSSLMIMTYMFSLSFGVVAMFCILLVPTLKQNVPLEKWDALQLCVWYFYVIVTEYWYVIIAVIGIISFAAFKSLSRWTGDIRFYFDRLPPYSIYKRLNGATFILNVNAMLSAGIPMETAINNMVDSCESPWMLERLEALHGAIESGVENLGTALDNIGFEFPGDAAIIKMKSLFETSNAEGSLKRFAGKWLDKTVASVEKTGELLRILGYFGCAGFIGILILIMSDLIQQAFFH